MSEVVRVHVSSLVEGEPVYCEKFFDGKGPVVFIGPHHLAQLEQEGRTLTDYEDEEVR